MLGGSSDGSSSGGNPLSSLGSTLSSLFSGAGNAIGSGATDVGNALSSGASALTGMSSANAAEQAFDPTGSIGAQETIDPPSAGSASDQQSSVGGTQSSGAPSSGTGQNQQPQTQSAQQYAPQSAVDGLKKALTSLAQGQPQTNPWQAPQQGRMAIGAPAAPVDGGGRMAIGAPQAAQPPVLPQLSPGETGPQSEGRTSAESEGVQRAGRMNAGLPTGAPDQTPVGDAAEASTGGAATAPPTATPEGPTVPSSTGGKPTPKTDDQGHPITVHAAEPGAAGSTDANGNPLPTKVPLPTKKPGLVPTKKPGAAPDFPPEPSQIMRDVTGGQGVPPALGQLAVAALGTLLPMLLSGGFGGGRRGGFRHGGGFHHGGEGHWPYHHPMMGWQLHGHHPGGGWRPLHPHHMRGMMQDGSMGDGQSDVSQIMQAMFGNSQQGQENQRQAGGGQQGGGGQADTTEYDASRVPMGSTERGTPGVSASQYDGFTRDYAKQIGIDPDTASRVLATESSFGQNIYGDYENGRPTSFGGFQLHLSADGKAMGNQYLRDTGHAPWDHKYWQEQVKYALDNAKKHGWGAWDTTRKKLGYGEWTGIGGQGSTRQASAPPAQGVATPPTMQSPSAGGYNPSPLG
jgi:hypothetical protein